MALTAPVDVATRRKAGAVPRLIHVTDAIPFSGDSDSPAMIAACERGTRVHKIAEDYDLGKPLNVEPMYAGYFVAWQMFRSTTGAEILEVELRIEDETLGCVGTIDRIATISGALWVLDIKTGGPWPTHGLQTACYEAMYRRARGVPVSRKIRRACVHVSGDGSYQMHEHKSLHDLNTWRAYARVAKFEIEAGLRPAPKER